MKKILLTLMIMAFLACPAMAQRYRGFQIAIVDEFGQAVTNIDTVEIYDAGTSTTSTIYSTRAGTARTNPMTTTSGGFDQSTGIARWFQAAASFKVTVTESGASQSLTMDNLTSENVRFAWFVNYIGEAATLQVTDTTTLDIGTSDDFVHDWDNANSRYIIKSAADGGRLDFGLAAVHTDVYFHAGDITTDYVFFDEGSLQMGFVDIDLLIDDEAKLLIGDSGDVTIEYDESNEDLDVLSTSALDEIAWGATGDGYDQKWWSTTSGDYMLFDYSADSLLLEDMTLGLGDAERIVLGGTIGTGSMFISVTSDVMEFGQIAALTGAAAFGNDDDGVDVTFYGDTASQKAWWDASGDEWFFGANAEGVDVTFYGDTASSYAKWDENGQTNGSFVFEAVDLHMMDADYVIFGDGSDFKLHSTTTKILAFTPAAASDDYQVLLGSDQTGVDLGLYGTTASAYALWDASANALWVEGSDIFLGDGDLVVFGDAIGTGDIKMYATGTDFIIDGIVAETGTVAIGLTDVGLDFKLWAATNAEGVLWDASDEGLEFTGANIALDATSELYDAVLAGTKVVSGIPITIVFRPDAAATLTWTVPTGYDLIVTDAIAWKTAGAGAHADDEWSLQHNDGSAANIFDKEELNTIGDKARILFDNLDDGENELEATETLDLVALENAGNGCDGIIIVSGYLKTAD